MSALLGVLTLLAALAAHPARAQHETKLTASDGASQDYFGYSVAVSGDYMVVGAYQDDDNGSASGSAYVYRRSGSSWVEEAKLTAADGALGDHFGRSVAINGDRIVVGASGDSDNGIYSGSAYVYRRSGSSWAEEAKLTAADGASGDYFGLSVAIDGDRVVIGAFGDEDSGIDSGSAYVYRRSGSSWAEEAKLTASDAAQLDEFGYSVAVSGDRVVVGAYRDDDNGDSSGSAYVYRRSGSSWAEEAKLTAADGASNDEFGRSVAIDGDRIAIGAYFDDDMGGNSGSAYVFRRSGSSWAEEAKLTAADGASSDYFGRSVAVSSDRIVAGAYGDDDSGSFSGSAYVFRRSGSSWAEEAKLTAADGASSDEFGRSVAIDGDRIVVGADGGDDNGSASGSAYVYEGALVPDSATLAFGSVDVRQPSTLSTTVSHFGATAITVSSIVSTDPAFTSSTQVPFTVSGGGSREVEVTFTPPAAGSHDAYVYFVHDGPAGRDSVRVTGTGVVARLVPAPTTLAFGTVSTGNTSSPQTVRLTRAGVRPEITVTRVYASDPSFAADVQTPFTVTTPVDVPLTFSPREGRPYDEWVYFEHDGTYGLDSVQVTGTGQFYARLTEFGTETTPTNFVNVLFRATGASGRGLDIPADYVAQHVDLFRVYDNNQEMDPTAPESFYQVLKLDEVPYSLRTVLLIDNSTSVGNDLDEIKEAAHLVVDNLAPSQELALYVFSSTWTQLEDFTDDRQALHAAIDGITLGGPSTALYTTLLEGLSRWEDLFTLTDLGNGQIDVDIDRGYLIALTDGEDQAGGATLAEVLAARGDKRVFTVGYGSVNTTVMQQLGNAGFFPVGDASQLPDAFAEVQEEIENDARSFYWLNYASPRRASQDWPLRICLRDNVYTGSGACAETTYNSTGFTDPLPGAFVNRSMQYLYGVEEVDVPENGVTLTATTILGLNPPVYEWTSSDASQVTVEPIAGTNQAIATRVGPVGGTATITLRDTANGFERTVNANLVVPTEEGAVPQAFALAAVYPNPAQGRVQVAYTVPAPVEVRLTLYDLLGRRVLTHEAAVAEGAHVATVETAALAAGVYVLRVEAGGAVATRRLTLVR